MPWRRCSNLDYSRKEGEWIPQSIREAAKTLEAIDFLRKFNHLAHVEFPGLITIAEESHRLALVTRSAVPRGLGFSFKWNMGWMHDTLGFSAMTAVYRKYLRTPHVRDAVSSVQTLAVPDPMTNFILPLSLTRWFTARARCCAGCRETTGSASPTCALCCLSWFPRGKSCCYGR